MVGFSNLAMTAMTLTQVATTVQNTAVNIYKNEEDAKTHKVNVDTGLPQKLVVPHI